MLLSEHSTRAAVGVCDWVLASAMSGTDLPERPRLEGLKARTLDCLVTRKQPLKQLGQQPLPPAGA